VPKQHEGKKKALERLAESINNRFFSYIAHCLIHASFIFNYFYPQYNSLILGVPFAISFTIVLKLFAFSKFFKRLEKELQSEKKEDMQFKIDEEFGRWSMVVTMVGITFDMLGLLFASFPTGYGYYVFFTEYDFDLSFLCSKRTVAVAFCMAWQSDNGGLLFGKLFGKHKLDVHISPNKTIEGILGAFILP